MSAAYDPTLPLGAAITFCVYRLFAKRKARSPDGPYWGNSPVWGALGTTLLGLLTGGAVRHCINPPQNPDHIPDCCSTMPGLAFAMGCCLYMFPTERERCFTQLASMLKEVSGILPTVLTHGISSAQVSWLLVQLLPLPARLRPEAVGIFVINIVLGLVCIFFK